MWIEFVLSCLPIVPGAPREQWTKMLRPAELADEFAGVSTAIRNSLNFIFACWNTMTRWGLCGSFRDESIKFANVRATTLKKMNRPAALAKLNSLCMQNASSLLLALQYCHANSIGCFRINGQILPLKTHPDCGYAVGDLPDAEEIVKRFRACGEFAWKAKMRTCFKAAPGIVLNSPRRDVVAKSIAELEYQAEVAQWVGADVLCIQGGRAKGDKLSALDRFATALDRLSRAARERVTVQNDDKFFTPSDLLPMCKATGVPLLYDLHHHRCNQDVLSVEQATKKARATWNREPMFRISSSLEVPDGSQTELHQDFVDANDVPAVWLKKKITVEVDAQSHELAVKRLMQELHRMEPEKPWVVYLLRCNDNSLYTGITNNLEKRTEKHNAGTASKYTRSRLPVQLIYQETQANHSEALKRELAIKALSRKAKEDLARD